MYCQKTYGLKHHSSIVSDGLWGGGSGVGYLTTTRRRVFPVALPWIEKNYKTYWKRGDMAMYVERNNPNGSGPQGQTGSGQSGSQGSMGSQGTMGSQNGSQAQNGSQQGMNGSMQGGQNGSGSMQKSGVDYRDDLRELLDKAHAERGLTRYRLCKQMGIDSGTLSNVLAKRRHFSLEKLEQILGLLGYRLTFTQQGEGMSATPASMN